MTNVSIQGTLYKCEYLDYCYRLQCFFTVFGKSQKVLISCFIVTVYTCTCTLIKLKDHHF